MTNIQVYTVDEVATLLKVSTRLVYSWIREGALPATRLGPGNRFIRVSHQELERFLYGENRSAEQKGGEA